MHVYRSTIDRSRYAANGEHRRGGRLWRFDEPGDLADAPSFGQQETGHHHSEAWTDGRNVQGLEANAACLKRGQVPSVLYDAFLAAREACDPVVQEASRVGNTTKRKRRYSDEGDEVNTDRLAANDPNCWERRKRGKKMRTFRIGISYSDHWAARERDYVSRAAAAAATVDALTALGYGTEVVAYSTGTVCDGNMEHGHEWTCAVRLKASDQPVDVQKLLVTGLTSMSRRFTFGIYEAEGGGPRWNSTCDGISRTMREELGLDLVLGDEASADFDPEILDMISQIRTGAEAAARDPRWTDEARQEAEEFAKDTGLEDLEAGAGAGARGGGGEGQG